MSSISRSPLLHALLACLLLALAGCGGGGGSSGGGGTAGSGTTGGGTPAAQTPTPAPLPANETPPTEADAVRFLTQATFGPTQTALNTVVGSGYRNWLAAQFQATGGGYSPNYSSAIHTAGLANFCGSFPFPSAYLRDNCWQEYYSAEPLSREFYRNAVFGSDQLRQRVALALGQVFVVSNAEVEGTYGLREYQQTLHDNAFGNVREILRKVTLSPVMGTYLNMVNNERADPNENFARELMQLFSIGLCKLNADGTLLGGNCQSTYDNNGVRDVAFALTGWTYPAGGVSPWGSNGWKNYTYLRGDMIPVPAQHDQTARTLPDGSTLAASRTPQQALDRVIDALFNHANAAPFLGRQLIQHLVTSNPSPAYVGRVSAAFASGTAHGFGNGQRGDMRAIIAAILLDPEARGDDKNGDNNYGRLREPAQFIAGMLRATNASTDGAGFYWWWGGQLGQIVFNANSVFNFYPPDFPLPGTTLVGPAFAIENANSTLARVNLGTTMLYWNGIAAGSMPGASGTQADLANWQALADNATTLVERVERLLVTGGLPGDVRSGIATAVAAHTATNNPANWRRERVATAFYLVLASPEYQVQR
ncbi:DUF1800 domain-containing protein [Uliginosibacterium sp. H1]|uniref:DUF1800 domain-containing protein n=1 Tax=Uliginosibacterium sp. H1 TaxID=3114757 RepID=UPI002E1933CF|nr:DUF1800 family protein [Uliginosibacterium sp. H1]